MRIVAFWSIVVAALLGATGLALALMGFIKGNNIPLGVLGVVLIVIPVGAAIWLSRSAASEGRPAFEAALANGFKVDERLWREASGIALDKTAGMLAIGDAKGTRIVPVRSITDVSYVAPRVSAASGTGAMAIFALFRQSSVASHNFSRAGLFVSADGQRSRIIGVPEFSGKEWQRLIAEAKAKAAS
ncbi:MAG: hypothetical protein ABIQ30_13835 [Devosia sp.]